MILTLPFLLVTLGFFLLALNAVMLLLTSAVSDALGLGFHVEVLVSVARGARRQRRELRADAVRGV